MRYSLLTIILILSIDVLGQKFKPLTIDTGREYKIINEDSLFDIWGEGFNNKELMKINADLSMPTNEHPRTKTYDIRFASGKILGDKIEIIIAHGSIPKSADGLVGRSCYSDNNSFQLLFKERTKPRLFASSWQPFVLSPV